MSHVLKPYQNIVFMKAGFHGNETLEKIVDRKRVEIDKTGYTFWGYGGGSCNPKNQVQPFAEKSSKESNPIYLCMSETKSKHRPAVTKENNYYSIDGQSFCRIPETIRVPDTNYALVIKSLNSDEFYLPLDKTKVAIGPNEGKQGHEYIKGQSDKACLTLSGDIDTSSPNSGEKIILVAELCPPYAVFLKGIDIHSVKIV